MSDNTTVWVVGLSVKTDGSWTWEMVGVFTDERLAVEACKDEFYFVGPMTLDENVHTGESVDWVGGYRPVPPSGRE